MFPDLLDSRPSPFTKVQTFELNREIPASSVDMPANVDGKVWKWHMKPLIVFF